MRIDIQIYDDEGEHVFTAATSTVDGAIAELGRFERITSKK